MKNNNKKNTVVINLFAGPGAEKTTRAWEIAVKLKKLGYVTEYVGEYAKELVWEGRTDMLDGSLKNQMVLMYEQKRRIDRLIGKVDFVVTDSPILLSAAYIAVPTASFDSICSKLFNEYNNFCIFIERGEQYQEEGRIHSREESEQLDTKIKNLLDYHKIFYGTYKEDSIDLSIKNMQTTYKRLNTHEVKKPELSEHISKAKQKRTKRQSSNKKKSYSKSTKTKKENVR